MKFADFKLAFIGGTFISLCGGLSDIHSVYKIYKQDYIFRKGVFNRISNIKQNK